MNQPVEVPFRRRWITWNNLHGTFDPQVYASGVLVDSVSEQLYFFSKNNNKNQKQLDTVDIIVAEARFRAKYRGGEENYLIRWIRNNINLIL